MDSRMGFLRRARIFAAWRMPVEQRYALVEKRLWDMGDQIGFLHEALPTRTYAESYFDYTIKIAPKELKESLEKLKSATLAVYDLTRKSNDEEKGRALDNFAVQMKRIERVLRTKVPAHWEGIYGKTYMYIPNSHPDKETVYITELENRVNIKL